ncbi:MAG: UvrD-helicase domain-containing protein [Clostridiales bacterium]|jgi:DNA helicase-2/ATP-dependent DNA helicase PcrA|nr:UvrD-helicase domain-containing protein [Clostridiales bacterium]
MVYDLEQLNEFDLKKLNEKQREVCENTEGAYLVIAGAGSGKTRTLTHRIAHLVQDKGVKAYNILAITFTNKATQEMRERLHKLSYSQDLWISTFHGLCLRILKSGIESIGYKKNFCVYGEQEKERLIKRIIKENNFDSDLLKKAMHYIGDAKSNDVATGEFASFYQNLNCADIISDIYHTYEKELKQANSLDFDDLLTKTVHLLNTCQDIKDYYAEKFRYIHIDEFQDTNNIQYQIVKLLASKHRNIFAVGDEDQSIYGWRGANVSNIKLFQREFGAQIFKLEQNYRSTKKILEVANAVIANNKGRIEKKLWTQNDSGNDVLYNAMSSDSREADFVVGLINNLINNHGVSPNEIAILMRLNALSRNFEERLLAYNIPYKVKGGFKFFDRKEIKDILAYFKVALNPDDNDSFLRCLNFPKKGIGEASISSLRQIATLTGQSLYSVVLDDSFHKKLSKSLAKKLEHFGQSINEIVQSADLPIDKFTNTVLKILNLKSIFNDNSEEDYNRLLNIEEFTNMVFNRVESNPDLSLQDFLDSITLYSEDAIDDDKKVDCVSISTIHSAKGLEFEVVFVVGCEQEIFPSKRSLDDMQEMEEERRLMYVALTRAKKRLYLTSCNYRFIYNQQKPLIPSVFLKETGLVSAYISKFKSDRPTGFYANKVSQSECEKPKFQFSHSNLQKSNKDFSQFKVGVNIVHQKFGIGKIVSLSGEMNSPYAKINFETMGTLELALVYAPIEVV